MSDWRENKSGKKEKPNKPTPMPVVPRKTKAEGTKTDWRNRAGQSSGSASVAAAGSSSRNWTKNNGKSPAPELGSLKRALRLAAIGGAIAASIAGFVIYIFTLSSPIPVLASVDESESQETAVAAYANSSRQRFSESTNLFRTMTFADRDKDSNYLLRAIMESKGEWVKEIRNNAKSSLASDFIGEQYLIGGGPNKNLIAFYFQGIISRDQDERWQLLASGVNPFDDQPSRDGVELSQLFRYIAESISPNSIALVALDVSTPSVVTNLGDLHFPADEIEAAFQSIGALADKLVVMLPCQDGQENWIAPELSASVFGHFVFEGLSTGFGHRDLTAKTFPTTMSESVRKWVSQNRRAVQTPKILSSLTDEQLNGFKFYRFLTMMPTKSTPISSASVISSRFDELDRYWTSLSKLEAYASWDPVLHGHLESSLVAMENVAESSASNGWSLRGDKFKQDIKAAEVRWNHSRKVSLIETAFHQRLHRCEVFLEKLLDRGAAPPTLTQLLESRSASDSTNRDDRAMSVWRWVESAASSNDATRWNSTFATSPIKQSLQYVGEPTPGQPDWLEVQLCRTLIEAVDAQNAGDDSARAMAKLLSCFSELQRVTSISYSDLPSLPFEKAAWIESEVFEIDRQFHSALDAFCANEWNKSIAVTENLLQPNGRIQSLRTKAKTIDQLIHARDETLRDVPHLLGLLMRTTRYTSMEANKVKAYAEKLAELLHAAKTVENQLASPHPGTVEEAKWIEDLMPLRSEILRLSRPIAQDGATTHDESIRDYRNALRYPKLSLNDRKEYHKHIASFYSVEKRTEQSDVIAPAADARMHSPRSIAEHFLAALERMSTIDRDIYKGIASSDTRLLQWPILAIDSVRAKLDAVASQRQQTYQTAARTKTYASSLAAKNLSAGDLPWRTPIDFGYLCEQEYCDFQASRLYHARWGSGRYSDNSESLYFRQLARQYQGSPKDSGAILPTNPNVPKLWEQARKDLAAILVHEAQNDSTNYLDVQLVRGKDEHSWENAIAAVRQWPRPSNSTAVPAVAPLPLSDSSQASIGFDYQAPELSYRLSIRGHTFDRPVDRVRERSKISIEFTKPTDLASVKLIASSDPQSIVILLDCSASMTHANAFSDARRTVRLLLENLKSLSELGVPSEVTVMAFGLKLGIGSQLPPGFVFAKAKGKLLNAVTSPKDESITPSAVIQTEKFTNTTSDDFDRLLDVMQHDAIRPEGITPLYNAMMAGTELLSLRQNKGRKLIVVSDGANDVNDEYTKFIKDKNGYICQFQELEQRVRSTDLALYFFQFDNEEFYRQRGYTPSDLAPLRDANRELFGLVNSKMGSMQRPFSDFATLQKSLTDSFSLPNVQLTYEGTNKSIPLEYAKTTSGLTPGWCQVTVQAPPSGKNEQTASALTTRLRITGNERFELHYSEQQRQLRVNPFPFETPPGFELRSKNTNGTNDTNNKDRLYAVHERNKGILFKFDRLAQVPFKVGVSNQSYAFVPRPQFVVATVAPHPENALRTKFLVSDVGYSASYPPQLILPALPLNLNQDKSVQLDVWYADTIPENYMESFDLRDGVTTLSKIGGATLKRSAELVSVQLASNPENRVFVICTESRSSVRDYFAATSAKGAEERHTFTLDSSPESVHLSLIDEASLRKAIDSGGIEHRFLVYTLSK